MIGAIIGDIVGSRFEFEDHHGKDFPLFVRGCKFTDDSLMTLAVAKSLLLCKGNYDDLSSVTVRVMKEIARPYPNIGWGEMFYKWLTRRSEPYNSMGNGAAMRVSPIGWVADSEEEVKSLSRKVTEISHNHPEGHKGAEAVAMAVYLARTGATKDDIRKRMREYYPILRDNLFNISTLLNTYGYDDFGKWITCEGSVPHAILAFLEGESFEDTIRNAVGIGGDSDTIGAMAGGIAEAYYGVPAELEETALRYFNDDLKGIYYAFSLIRRPRVVRNAD